MRSFACVLVLGLLSGCGGRTEGDTASIGGGASGGQAGGAQAGSGGKGGGAQAGSSQAGSAQAGKGGASGQAGQGGSGGKGGSSAGGSAGGSSAGGSSAGGAGGSAAAGGSGPGCCASDEQCGDYADFDCVHGVCKPPPLDGRCWDSDGCAKGEVCVGASVCPCGSFCEEPDQQGSCAKAGGKGWDSCEAPGDCLLQDDGCCPGCDTPQPSDVDAVNYGKTSLHQQDVCPDGPGACEPCSESAPPNADLAAFCEAKSCRVVEVSKHAISACTQDAQCIVRRASCCDCGSSPLDQLVAMRADAQGIYEAQVCGPGKGGCTLDCDGGPPPDVIAYCDPLSGHCAFAVPQ